MQIKSPIFNKFGTIDCEIEHPDYGWIPFTANPEDVEPIGKEIYDRILAGEAGEIAPYEPDPEETEGLEDETENHNGSNDAADSD